MVPDTGPEPRPTTPAPARRASGPGWRDPRLWVGIIIVTASVVLGARLLASADDTVEVWAAGSDLGPGETLSAEDLVAVRVRFADAAQLDRYLPVTVELPVEPTLLRGLEGGELLPRSSLGEAETAGTVQVAVAVDDVRVPSSVGPGSVVDIYLLSGGAVSAQRAEAPERVLHDVTVLASSLEEGFASSGQRKLELGVPSRQASTFFDVLAGDTEPVLSVARQP